MLSLCKLFQQEIVVLQNINIECFITLPIHFPVKQSALFLLLRKAKTGRETEKNNKLSNNNAATSLERAVHYDWRWRKPKFSHHFSISCGKLLMNRCTSLSLDISHIFFAYGKDRIFFCVCSLTEIPAVEFPLACVLHIVKHMCS